MIQKYFEKMIELKSKTNLNELSMGMSNDYVEILQNVHQLMLEWDQKYLVQEFK